ncbi:TetR/AcrR family transcriptional regulator [Nocardia panacis]|uniref:TetR/AcrR family transcriptional regulator n=1 Tax=Nocardia panacis TaxID=2340916 RepID=A0A3A4K828_9NOCA|nr:TetR/AcrR family transcriptional regulator [Nocardia panacis]RJO75204.1 TetR/AcrR family transcriptional regulator [Nocardia panacis]
MAEVKQGLREQKKMQTRIALSMAARRLAAERGLDATHTDDIAKAVGVSPRTFFNYYDTKLDAVVGATGDIGTPSIRAEFVAGGPTGDLVEDLIQLYTFGLEPDAEVRESVLLVARLIQSEPRVLAAFFAEGMRREASLGELLTARMGAAATPQLIGVASGIMTALTTRASYALAADPDASLTATVRDHCRTAAQLFGRSAVRKGETP